MFRFIEGLRYVENYSMMVLKTKTSSRYFLPWDHLSQTSKMEQFVKIVNGFQQFKINNGNISTTCSTHSMPMVSSFTSWKHQKAFGFFDVFNSFMTEVLIILKPVHWFAATCYVNQWTGFYMTRTSVTKKLRGYRKRPVA